MKIVFFGTPEYVLPIITKLNRAFKANGVRSPIVAVVTQRPKPVGKEKKLTYSPVDTWAYERKIPIYFDGLKIVEEKMDVDLGILAAYGNIIPEKVIKYFPKGILNIHPSLLPQYRGASPVQAAIVNGETSTGVSVIRLDSKVDHGPIVSSFKEEVKDNDTAASLRERLFERSADFLTALVPAYLTGKINLKEQEHPKATFTKVVEKENAYIPGEFLNKALSGRTARKGWSLGFIKDFKIKPSPETVERFIRAMQPWPIAWTKIKLNISSKKAMRLKIFQARVEEEKLILEKVQLEGKNPVSWKQFREGYKTVMFE